MSGPLNPNTLPNILLSLVDSSSMRINLRKTGLAPDEKANLMPSKERKTGRGVCAIERLELVKYGALRFSRGPSLATRDVDAPTDDSSKQISLRVVHNLADGPAVKVTANDGDQAHKRLKFDVSNQRSRKHIKERTPPP